MYLQHQLCFEVYKAANQFTKLYTKTLQPFGLTYPQYIVLLALYEEDSQTTSSLCKRLSLGIGTLHPILQKLTEKGWLVKSPSATDRRAAHFTLSDQAKQAKPNIEQAIYDKLACSDYLATEGFALKEQIKQLNQFLHNMNQEETR